MGEVLDPLLGEPACPMTDALRDLPEEFYSNQN
jgi:hypothetical protein